LLIDNIINVVVLAIEISLKESIILNSFLDVARKILFQRLFIGVLSVKEIENS